jgi:hypothetical protein
VVPAPERQCRLCETLLSRPRSLAVGLCYECSLSLHNGVVRTEVWLRIVGHPGFELSTYGRVRDSRTHALVEPDRSGRYPGVWLNGRRRALHVLMAETHIGPRPYGALVLHGDDDPSHCHISNISYGDHAQNAEDARRNRALAPLGRRERRPT